MNPVVTSLTLTAAASTGIFSGTISTAGAVTLSGSLVTGTVATMATARRVAAVSASAGDTTQTLKITGTNKFGNVISETITLNGTTPVSSVNDYKTVTSIVAGGSGYPTAGSISIGTNTTASTEWFFSSREMTPFSVSAAIQTGTGTTANLDYTFDDPNVWYMGSTMYQWGSVNPNSVTPPVVWQPTGTIGSGVTATKADAALTEPVFAYRMTVTAGTNTATLWLTQSGINGAGL